MFLYERLRALCHHFECLVSHVRYRLLIMLVGWFVCLLACLLALSLPGQQCASPDAASASASTTMPLQKIMFVLFGEKEYKAFDEAAKEHFEEGGEK